MNVRLMTMVGVLGASIAWLGCGGPNVAELEQKWHTDKDNIAKYRSKYPSFAPAFDEMSSSGDKDIAAAKASGDAKSQATKISAVTDRVEATLSEFDNYDKERDSLQTLMKDKTLNDLPASKFNPANDAAKAALKKADDDMSAKATNTGEAKGKVEDATRAIHAAEAGLQALKPAGAAPAAASPSGTAKKKK